MQIEMTIKGLMVDPITNMPIIILRDDDDKRSLPIWVGIFEANAIALELEKIPTPRPMTHDLIKNILESLEAQVLKAEQSNTSIVYGDQLILKIFRRLDVGINPELEIGRFLTKQG